MFWLSSFYWPSHSARGAAVRSSTSLWLWRRPTVSRRARQKIIIEQSTANLCSFPSSRSKSIARDWASTLPGSLNTNFLWSRNGSFLVSNCNWANRLARALTPSRPKLTASQRRRRLHRRCQNAQGKSSLFSCRFNRSPVVFTFLFLIDCQ